MEAVPLVPKARVLPNLDAVPLIKQLFQNEFQAVVPTKKLSQNILTSFQYHEEDEEDEGIELQSTKSLKSITKRNDNVIEFTENVLEAYVKHQRNTEDIRKVEEHIFEAHAHFLKQQLTIINDSRIRDFLSLKRQPLLRAFDANYVKKYKLLQGEAGLPPEYELNSDFRVKKFKKLRKKLNNSSEESLVVTYQNKSVISASFKNCPKKEVLPEKPKKIKKPRPKNKIANEKQTEILRAEPKIIFFTDYKLGDVYIAEISVKNIHTKGVKFQIKPMCPDGPFKVMLNEKCTTTVSSGLSFQLMVEFYPKNLDNASEDIVILTEDGSRLLIPLIAYLEPPILKTHKEIDEFTKITSERIASSYIECGVCFTGDTKVTKLKFRCYRGCGEFFIMSSENWSRSCINTVTSDNLLEIPPFRVYPVFFKIEKDEVIDLFVEFSPKHSGTHVENIIIACDNGQIRSLDLLGDAVGWHSYYFSFQDSLLKDLPVEKDDDVKVKYYLDFEDTTANGKVEKVFCVCNNSNMPFEFQWKIREANISSHEKYLKICKYEVKIDPESGTFEPNSVWEFLVTVSFNNAEVGNYRMILSLYVLNLPYQCIEEDNTIIQPTGLVRNLYSQSLYGEEDNSALSPELASLQGTYESLQESIKSYVECQNKTLAAPRYDFCRTICIPNPGLCAKPLKKSKTFFNIGEDEGLGCVCRMKAAEPESNSESCNSNPKDDKANEMSPQRIEVVWDFVDILVDEVEIWVEVVPTRVTLEPSFLQLKAPLNINEQPVFKEVRIINHNQCSIACSWLIKSETLSKKKNSSSENSKNDSASFAFLFNKKAEINNRRISGGSFMSNKYHQQSLRSKSEKSFEHEEKNKELSQPCKIVIKPSKTFSVSGLSEFDCEIGISARQAGEIEETLCLNVNEGDLSLMLLISGTAVKKSFHTSPDIIDFGVLKEGTRYTKEFSIVNESSIPLSWKINQFEFDFNERKFQSDLSSKDLTLKKTSGIFQKKENSIIESCCLDARVRGVKCSLLEVEEVSEPETSMKQYILVLGDVKTPKLFLSSPRFENAILAPPGMMYVGRTISTKVTLTNIGVVETFFTWGHPFGCHSRKIKVDINPKSCRIEKKKKLTVDIELTALDEGIISHCYIPCFFCRSAEPLILSVVGMAENVNVTFEIIDYPMQTHMNPSTLLKSPFFHTVLRIPWPIKIYDSTLGLKHINEQDLIDMKCQCQEVEEECVRAFGGPKQEAVPEVAASEKSVGSSPSLEISDINSQKSKNSLSKSNKVATSEDLKLSNSNLSGSCALESKKSEENSVVVYNFVESSESLLFKKTQMDFLNVPYKTPILRQFVIRNETPLETNFNITVRTYGVSRQLPDRRLETIRDKVFGYAKDDFQNKLMKDQPLVIIVEPSRGELKPLDAVCINVYCYGVTWGEYRDHLICKIRGIEPFHLKIFIQIVGHPIHFPMFRTQESQKPTLRFQPLSYTENPIEKQIKVINRSSIPLNVVWMVFLSKPLPKEEEKEDSYNLCVDSNANFDSNHSGEESTKSSKNYIPKNTSESVLTIPNVPESKDFSQNSETFKSLGKTELSSSSSLVKNEKRDTLMKKLSIVLPNESKLDVQQIFLPEIPDTRIFQIDPKEMCFKPFEEKKMTITFDPQFCKPGAFPHEFQGVLASCVKLKPEDEKCPNLYYRPCGISFASELMDLNAVVEVPLVSIEILRGDLKFIVDSNAVIKSKSKDFTILRKFLIKNTNQKSLTMKIEILPGVMFRVLRVNSLDKFYPKYNPKVHDLKMEPEQTLEIELQCLITYKDVIYAFERLKLSRKKKQCPSADDLKLYFSKSSNDYSDERQREKEPWKHFFDSSIIKPRPTKGTLGPKDSLEINLNRISSKSDNSFCKDNYGERPYYPEVEGECYELSRAEEMQCKPTPQKHTTVMEEQIRFVQLGLIIQSVTVELHVSFPALRISPKSLDFGNVYLGEIAVRYCSIINLTGFSTDFKVTATTNVPEFVANPQEGCLPASNYNSDIGKTITVEFKPSQPGYFKEVFYVYGNLDAEFDFYELFVFGFGTWDEKYKSLKFETYTKLDGVYPQHQK